MRRLITTERAFHLSIWLHVSVVVAVAMVSTPSLMITQFAGQQKAVTISATFSEPVSLSEPEPVEFTLPSEQATDQSHVDATPNSAITKQRIDFLPQRREAEFKVEPELKLPPRHSIRSWR